MKNLLLFIVSLLAFFLCLYLVNTGLEAISKPHDMAVAGGIGLFAAAALIALGAYKLLGKAWRSKSGAAAPIALLLLVATGCNERIDAGHVGLRVKDYGTEKGVSDIAEVTGRVWYNPFTERVIEVPTFVQNAVYTADERSDSKGNDEFRVTTRDGMIVAFDVSLNYYVTADQAAPIFRKYRRPFKELERGILMNNMRDAFNRAASNYKADEIYEKRAAFQQEAEDAVTAILGQDGFVVEQVVLLNELRLPQEVNDNIKAKVNATQIALQKTAELQQSIADANKKVALARGDSSAQVIRAAGEAEAYNRIRKELTKEMIELHFIEKWDGKLPVYGTTPQMFKNVQ
jgi:regulator of protease activity HflC (stomatin/prohibitin superfamily)